jgi:small subunit ribosomal protein S21
MKYQKYRNNGKNFNGTKGGDTQPATVNGKQIGPGDAIQAKPLEVRVYGNFDRAFRAFRTLVQKERVLSTYKEKQSYEKPSDKRRRKINEAKRKQMEICSKGECKHTEHAKNSRTAKRKSSSE